MLSYKSIPSEKPTRLIGTANEPVLIDVRTDEGFAGIRRNPQMADQQGKAKSDFAEPDRQSPVETTRTAFLSGKRSYDLAGQR